MDTQTKLLDLIQEKFGNHPIIQEILTVQDEEYLEMIHIIIENSEQLEPEIPIIRTIIGEQAYRDQIVEIRKNMIPKQHNQKVTDTSVEIVLPEKFECIDGEIFGSQSDQDNAMHMLLYNIGLERFIKILPKESKEILRELLNKSDMS